jgi:hypothetical protein
MERSHTFINVSPHRAKVRHQQTRRKVPLAKAKHQRKSSAVRPLEGSEAYPTPHSLSEDVAGESDVEEVPRSDALSKSLEIESKTRNVTSMEPKSMPLRLAQMRIKKEDIHDLFSASGNLHVPYYVKTYESRPSDVPHMLNYYLHVAGPTAMWRPVLVDGDPENFKRSFFQFSMKEPIMFEAVISISRAHLDLSEHPGSHPSTAVLLHRGKVLRMLQSSLVSSPGRNVPDNALMAVLCMLVLDIMYADWTSVEANMQGFRHLAGLRGGIDNLGWSGWFRMCFSWAELRWAGHIARANSMRNITVPLEIPTYPAHPFNPATCLSISRLPEGLREAALQRQLCNEVISFLEQVQTWTTGPHKECAEVWVRQPVASFMRDRNDYLKSLQISVQGAELLGKYTLRPSERLLCIGVVAYIISADGSADDGRQAKGLDDHLVGIKTVCAEARLCDYLLWAGLVLAASTDGHMAPLSNHCVLLDHMLELDRRNNYREWKDLQMMLRKYFWNPFIEAKWEVCWQAAVSRKFASGGGYG